MGVLLAAALIVAGTAFGVVAERRRPTEAIALARRLMRIVLFVLLPIVIFFNLAKAHISVDSGVGLLIAWVAILTAMAITGLVADRVLGFGRVEVGTVMVCTLVANTSYLGYPLTVALLGHDHLSTGVLYDVLVSSPAMMLCAFAVAAAFGARAGEGWRGRVRTFVTRNPPLYAAILGLAAPQALAPTALVDASQILAMMVLPIGFFAVGATLAEGAEQGQLPLPPPITRPVALAVGSRLILAPALLTALAAPVIDLPSAYRLLSAMPIGLNSLVISHAYGLDNRTIAESIVWSTAIVIAGALISLLF